VRKRIEISLAHWLAVAQRFNRSLVNDPIGRHGLGATRWRERVVCGAVGLLRCLAGLLWPQPLTKVAVVAAAAAASPAGPARW
jgi:hypothetical protein